MSDSPADFDAVIADLNARMLATLLMPPMRLGPEPLRCPACGRTRMACIQFYGHDPTHDEDIRSRVREATVRVGGGGIKSITVTIPGGPGEGEQR